MVKKIKPLLLLGLALIAAYCSYDMYMKANAEKVWGYQTLFLFLSAWLFLLGIFERKFTKLLSYKRYIGLSLLSGALLWLGFPSPGLSPLLLIAWVPMLVVERDVSLHYGGIKKREIFKFAFTAAMTWNILSTYWVGNSALIAGIFAVIVNSLLMTLPWILGHVIRHKMPKLSHAPLVCFWLGFEYLHFHWDLSWPWLTLGNGFASFHSWIQWYDIVGVLGGSLWIWICNVSIFNLWNKYKKSELKMSSYFAPILAILIPLIFSLYQYYSFEDKGEKIVVACVQPNNEPHYDQGNENNISLLTRTMEMGEGIIDTTTNFLLFPEATFSRLDETKWERNDAIRAFQMITNMEFPDLNILAGITGFKELDDKEVDLPSTRMSVRGSDTMYYQVFNAAVQIGEGNMQMYKKSKLVIGPEYMPFGGNLGFMESYISNLGGTLKGLATQENREVFITKKGNAAPVICYEQNFGDFMRGYMKNGADFIAIITNDGWWGNTDGYRQHREFARLRAIEYRRSIARAANTGSSCFINPRGDMTQATNYNEAKVIQQEITLNASITNYAIMGDMVGRLAMFLGIIFLLNAFVIGRIKNKTT